MISESTWLSTLFEVKRQGLLFLNKEESSDASSAGADEWVTIDREDAGDPEWSELWPQHQWQVAFEILFLQKPHAAGSTTHQDQDDMLFFVPLPPDQAALGMSSPPQKLSPRPNSSPRSSTSGRRGRHGAPVSELLVRRRVGRELPAELQWGGAQCAGVDWRASVLLNIVLQTAYSLVVATCRQQRLSQLVDRGHPSPTPSSPPLQPPSHPAASPSPAPAASHPPFAAPRTGLAQPGRLGREPEQERGREGEGGGPAALGEVCKVVYASPCRVPLSLDNSRGGSRSPAPCYPDIAFAVEDFDHAFSSVVLTHPEDCYCVLLYAHAAASWLPDPPAQRSPSPTGERETATSLPPPAPPAQPSHHSAAPRTAPGTAEVAPLEGRLGDLQLGGGGGGGGVPEASCEPRADASQIGSGITSSSQSWQHQNTHQGAKTASPKAASGFCGGQGGSCGAWEGGAGTGAGGTAAPPHPLLFSGFVSHALLAAALAPKLRGGILGGGRLAERTSRVVMRGPGGHGGADVAVTSIPPAGLPVAPGADTQAQERDVGGAFHAAAPPAVPKLLAKASLLASGAVRAARSVADAARATLEGGGRDAEAELRLRCALMTLTVPVDELVAGILGVL